MAWSMDQSSYERVPPSIAKAFEAAGETDAERTNWLAEELAAPKYDAEGKAAYEASLRSTKLEAARLGPSIFLQELADKTTEKALTTNGGWEIYLPSGATIPWASDDECKAWWAAGGW